MLVKRGQIICLHALGLEDLVRGVVDDQLRSLAPKVVHHGHLADGKLKDDVLIIEAGLQANVISHEVPVRVNFILTQDLPLERV